MKKILFGAPNHFGIYKKIIQDFERNGYEVTSICLDEWPEGLVDKLRSRLLNIADRFFATSWSRTYKAKQQIINKLAKYQDQHFDICFMVRPDIFPPKLIELAKQRSKRMMAYQWDGIDRYPSVIPMISTFDMFIVFDRCDFKKYSAEFDNIELGSNFYFDDKQSFGNASKSKLDVFYLGAYEEKRNKKLFKLYNLLSQAALKIKIVLVQIPINQKDKAMIEDDSITVIDKLVDYSSTLQMTKAADVIIDLVIDQHSGFSFRLFEALNYNKKVITTNLSVLDADFYHPDNILVFDEEMCLDALSNFLNKPVNINQEVKDKYRFITWFEAFSSKL